MLRDFHILCRDLEASLGSRAQAGGPGCNHLYPKEINSSPIKQFTGKRECKVLKLFWGLCMYVSEFMCTECTQVSAQSRGYQGTGVGRMLDPLISSYKWLCTI